MRGRPPRGAPLRARRPRGAPLRARRPRGAPLPARRPRGVPLRGRPAPIASILLLLLMLLLGAIGCGGGDDNYLEGSLTESYDLSFDETRIRLYESELSIEYLVETDEGQKVTLRLTVTRGEGLVEEVAYDLTTEGTVGRGEGWGSALPTLESGTLTMSGYGAEPGVEARGTFTSIFLTSDGSRLSLRGGFFAPLEVVDF